MDSDAPRVRLPRPHRAGLPAAVAVILGMAAGAMLGHPFVGALVGLAVWYRYRATADTDGEG